LFLLLRVVTHMIVMLWYVGYVSCRALGGTVHRTVLEAVEGRNRQVKRFG